MTQFERAMLILASAQTEYLELMTKRTYGRERADDYNRVPFVAADAKSALIIHAPDAMDVLARPELPKGQVA